MDNSSTNNFDNTDTGGAGGIGVSQAGHDDVVEYRNKLIEYYHREGYGYQEIVDFLKNKHRILISLRHFKRVLVSLGLKRRKLPDSPDMEILSAIIQELNGSGKCLGYKSLWKRLVQTYGLRVQRDIILQVLRVLDPIGVKQRKIHRLRRRKYINSGPNFLWHLDGYDKLKPFGFPIHGCIDGYSRKLLWLEVASTNNNPDVVSFFYLNTIKKLGFVPRVIRSDRGTENSTIELLQQALRFHHHDKLAGVKSFFKGKSTANQRIESYWSQMRRSGADFWISFFKDMRDSFNFDSSNKIHFECIRYCFGPLINYELQQTLEEWNKHQIRRQKNRETPAGRPNHLFYCAAEHGARNYKKKINLTDVDILLDKYTVKPSLISPSFTQLVHELIPNLIQPVTPEQALQQYELILDKINEFNLTFLIEE